MEKHHKLRRPAGSSIHACNICGIEGHQAMNCVNGTVDWGRKWPKEMFQFEQFEQRIAVNRVRASGGINNSRVYILTNTETGEELFVQDAAEFEERHKLTQTVICRTANPKQTRQKFITVDGVKFTARYAD